MKKSLLQTTADFDITFDRIDGKTSQGWHIYYVFTDPEFEMEVLNLLQAHSIQQGKMFNKQDINKNDLGSYTAEEHKLGQKYGITGNLIRMFAVAGKKAALITANTGTKSFHINHRASSKRFELVFHEDMPKSEFMKAWDDMQRMKAMNRGAQLSVTKRKPAQNQQLIYAIFKARKQGQPFRQIFELYSHQALPGYLGKKPIYSTKEALAAYFHKYDPSKLEYDTYISKIS